MSKFKVKTKSGELKTLDQTAVEKLLDAGSLKLATPILIVDTDQWTKVSKLSFINNEDDTNPHELKKLQLELQAEKEKNEILQLALEKKTQLLELLKDQFDSLPTHMKIIHGQEDSKEPTPTQEQTNSNDGPQLRTITNSIPEEEPVAEVDDDLFEIIGDEIWQIKGVKGLDDIYTILQIKDFRKQGKISSNTFIKKEGHWWKRYHDHYELHVPLQSVPFHDHTKVYIKKEQVRAPFKELIKINIDDKFNQAQMLNISIGGCQIKVKTKMQHMFTQDREIEIVFADGSVFENSILKGVIKRAEEEETNVLTCGIQFVDLSIKDKDILANIINNFTGDETFAA